MPTAVLISEDRPHPQIAQESESSSFFNQTLPKMAHLLLRLPQLLDENQSGPATSSERTGLEFRLLLHEEAGVVLISQVSTCRVRNVGFFFRVSKVGVTLFPTFWGPTVLFSAQNCPKLLGSVSHPPIINLHRFQSHAAFRTFFPETPLRCCRALISLLSPNSTQCHIHFSF